MSELFSFTCICTLIFLNSYANRSARFISAYYYGLTGVDAVWAARKYAGHRILPPDILADIKEFVKK